MLLRHLGQHLGTKLRARVVEQLTTNFKLLAIQHGCHGDLQRPAIPGLLAAVVIHQGIRHAPRVAQQQVTEAPAYGSARDPDLLAPPVVLASMLAPPACMGQDRRQKLVGQVVERAPHGRMNIILALPLVIFNCAGAGLSAVP
jgi:hypothetical protein